MLYEVFLFLYTKMYIIKKVKNICNFLKCIIKQKALYYKEKKSKQSILFYRKSSTISKAAQSVVM